jgi:hypothetical protein
VNERPTPEKALPSRFAWLALVSLMPLVAIVVMAKATANALDYGSGTSIMPRSTDEIMRLGVIAAVSLFILVRLWLMTARSVAVSAADIDEIDRAGATIQAILVNESGTSQTSPEASKSISV